MLNITMVHAYLRLRQERSWFRLVTRQGTATLTSLIVLNGKSHRVQ